MTLVVGVSTGVLGAASVAETLLLAVVLVLALLRVRALLARISGGLKVVSEAVGTVEQDLRQIAPAGRALNDPLDTIVDALPSIAEQAETVARLSRAGRI